MTTIVTKASGINSSWKVLYDEELTAPAKNITIDNLSGNQAGVLKVILSTVLTGTGAPAMVLNDDRTVANYRYCNYKALGTGGTVVTDTTTLPEFPLTKASDLLFGGGVSFYSEISIVSTSTISAERLIRCDSSYINSGSPTTVNNTGSWDTSNEVTKILLTGDQSYGDTGLDLFLFGIGTRVQVLGMNR